MVPLLTRGKAGSYMRFLPKHRFLFNKAHLSVLSDVFWVGFGQAVGLGLGLISSLVLLARALGPTEFGQFSVAFGIMTLVAGLMDLGLKEALVRFAAPYIRSDPQKAKVIFEVGLALKLSLGMLGVIVGLFVAPLLSHEYFHDSSLDSLLPVAFLGSFGYTAVNYTYSVFQASGKFLIYGLYLCISAAIRLLILWILWQNQLLNPISAVATYGFVGLISFLAGFVFFPGRFEWGWNSKKSMIARNMLGFGKWITVGAIAFSFVEQLPVLVLAREVSVENTALFSVGLRFALAFSVVLMSLSTTLAPKITQMTTQAELRDYSKRVIQYVWPLGILIFPALMVLAPFLVEITSGPEYLAAVPVFRILCIVYVTQLMLTPLNAIATFAIKRPVVPAVVNIAQAITCWIILPIFAKTYGLLGVTSGYTLIRVGGSLVVLFYVAVHVLRRETRVEVV